MQGYMFRSKLGALIFVAGILFAVFRMVGTEEAGGEIATAGERIAAQRDGVEVQGHGGPVAPARHAEDLQAEGWGDEVLPPAR